MSPTMKARTNYDFALLVDLQRMGAHTGNRQWILLRKGILLAATAACVLIGGSILLSTDGNAAQAGVYFLLAAGLACVFCFFHQVSAWRLQRKIGKKKVPDEFVFGPEGVDITRGAQSVHYDYTDCDRLLETELAFYLFHHKGAGLVIGKGEIQGGTADELRSFLEEKCRVSTQWVGRGPKA